MLSIEIQNQYIQLLKKVDAATQASDEEYHQVISEYNLFLTTHHITIDTLFDGGWSPYLLAATLKNANIFILFDKIRKIDKTHFYHFTLNKTTKNTQGTDIHYELSAFLVAAMYGSYAVVKYIHDNVSELDLDHKNSHLDMAYLLAKRYADKTNDTECAVFLYALREIAKGKLSTRMQKLQAHISRIEIKIPERERNVAAVDASFSTATKTFHHLSKYFAKLQQEADNHKERNDIIDPRKRAADASVDDRAAKKVPQAGEISRRRPQDSNTDSSARKNVRLR